MTITRYSSTIKTKPLTTFSDKCSVEVCAVVVEDENGLYVRWLDYFRENQKLRNENERLKAQVKMQGG